MLNLGYRDRSKVIIACVSEQELKKQEVEKKEQERKRKEQENTNHVIDGVKQLRNLLTTIEDGDAYKKRGARTVSKELAKYANKNTILE